MYPKEIQINNTKVGLDLLSKLVERNIPLKLEHCEGKMMFLFPNDMAYSEAVLILRKDNIIPDRNHPALKW